ncbi:unnamed protein product [Rotaria socialis]
MDDELYNLKQEHEIEIKKLKTEHETQKQEMTQSWQLINLQFKTQAEAIVDIYTTISEILPPVVQSLQTINQVIEEINRNVIDENERQRKQIIFTTIKETIFSLNSRLCLLTDHQQKLKTLMDKKKFIAERRSGKNWKRAQQKKSTDTEGISAFLLHQLPTEYLQIVTIAFNKIAQSGIVLRKSKHAKVICLSKDGLYPAVDKLRPISLLSNFGKCFERIIHTRILKWCNDKGIFTDEQSGFTSERRLQARILSLVEDLRLTTAANNRPSLVIFVDFVSAFDKNVAPCTSYHTSQTRHSVTTTTVDFSVAQRKNNVNPCWRSGFTCSQHLCWQTSRFSPCRYSFSSTCPFPPIIFYEPSLPLICGRSGYNYL